MSVRAVASVLALMVLATVAAAQAPRTDRMEDLPPGEGREVTFALCSACHGLLIVRQQGQSRERWDDTITFMVKSKGMPPIDDALRKTIVDYLAGAFPPRRSRTPTNPFLQQ